MKRMDLRSKRMSIAVGAAVPVAILFGALFLYFFESGPGCIFYRLTGLYCAGCGMGRAVVALLHLDVLGALGQNPLAVLLLPFVAYYCLKLYISYVFGKDILPFFKIGKAGAIALTAAVIAFWILRNIPVVPFEYLAHK